MNDALQARLNGQLPEIDIAGDLYVVDLARQRLYLKNSPANVLWLEDMDVDSLGEGGYEFFYHTPSKQKYSVDYDHITGLPPEVIQIRLPHDGILDAVHEAKYNPGISYLDQLIERDQQIELFLEATVIPLRKTNLQRLAIGNILRRRDNKRGIRPKL
ncbi:MAG: hypothetical protein J7497_15380 [Chitinophagaceae bacterium]|nr:hypothetical protein [Chitinophagaceae bacterium]